MSCDQLVSMIHLGWFGRMIWALVLVWIGKSLKKNWGATSMANLINIMYISQLWARQSFGYYTIKTAVFIFLFSVSLNTSCKYCHYNFLPQWLSETVKNQLWMSKTLILVMSTLIDVPKIFKAIDFLLRLCSRANVQLKSTVINIVVFTLLY